MNILLNLRDKVIIIMNVIGHISKVVDVKFNKLSNNTFSSLGYDRNLSIWV